MSLTLEMQVPNDEIRLNLKFIISKNIFANSDNRQNKSMVASFDRSTTIEAVRAIVSDSMAIPADELVCTFFFFHSRRYNKDRHLHFSSCTHPHLAFPSSPLH